MKESISCFQLNGIVPKVLHAKRHEHMIWVQGHTKQQFFKK